MGLQLGNLEEMVLLLVLVLEKEEAYGVSVASAYQEATGKSISIPAIHTVLKRLETKKLLTSRMGEATRVRGGKKKRLYSITTNGYEVLREIQLQREQLWSQVPGYQLR